MCYRTCAGGYLSREQLRSLPGVKDGGLVKKYIDKSGKKRHVGVPSKLKQSQCLFCTLVFPVLWQYISLSSNCFALQLRAYTEAFGQYIAELATSPKQEHWRTGSKLLSLCFIQIFGSLQDLDPGPRDPVQLDTTCGDAELFQRFFFPTPEACAVSYLGDMWEDVICLQYMCQCMFASIKRDFHNLIFFFANEAHMPSVLRYLAGCKYFSPCGRWASHSVEVFHQFIYLYVLSLLVVRPKSLSSWH